MTVHRKTRREFLKTGSAVMAAAPFVSRLPRAPASASKFDPNFGTATQAVQAIRKGVISSRELVEHVFERIKKYNPKINAFVTMLEEQAMAQAKNADEKLARKGALGALHGLPIVVKDAFATEGARTTAGAKRLEHYVPKEDAVIVARLKQAGAIIVGKTNVPEFVSDWQSYNQIVGTSNNPWDLTRTPGGSTGGGAAALAVGFGFLEVGSDIGGSIRHPSNFCGIYGHKSTIDLVPTRGHIPPMPGVVVPDELAVAGPLARSAEDLRLELEVIAGPLPEDSIAYSWHLPAPRKNRLRDYRIGYVIEDPFCPLDSTVKEVLLKAIEALRKSGVQLMEGWPAGVDPKVQSENYSWLLAASVSAVLPEAGFKGVQQMASLLGVEDTWVKGLTSLHRDWLGHSTDRMRSRTLWQEYFKTYDAFLSPVSFLPAFPHTQDHTQYDRKLMTTEGQRPYLDLARWISFATLTGCPSTVAPVGRTRNGLPVGIQIMGPFLEDATPIDIAMKMVDATGTFVAPPEFTS
ncbi:MAG TPA: amidase [Blastocatellia bacterium]|nr:amidase [Blastocatellia bacterium]